MIPFAKQFENKLGSQTRKRRAILPKVINFRIDGVAFADKETVRSDVDGDEDLGLPCTDVEVNGFPFERHTRVGMR